ncbi:MAG TPA: hypothetical protein GX717_04090 [Clostridiaceae bacterium]|jgi:hypothetical protein|nr:hypothetical protein [Clostridiaceae bacterium]
MRNQDIHIVHIAGSSVFLCAFRIGAGTGNSDGLLYILGYRRYAQAAARPPNVYGQPGNLWL